MKSEVVSLSERLDLLNEYSRVLKLLQITFCGHPGEQNDPLPVSFVAVNEADEKSGLGQMCVHIEFAEGCGERLPTTYYVHDRARPFPRPDNDWGEELITALGSFACVIQDQEKWRKLHRDYARMSQGNQTPSDSSAGAEVIAVDFVARTV